jgi:hypothetical protein
MDADLFERLNEIFGRCLETELRLPWVLWAVSPASGRTAVLRLHGAGKPYEVLAGDPELDDFALPLTIVVVDRRNEILGEVRGRLRRCPMVVRWRLSKPNRSGASAAKGLCEGKRCAAGGGAKRLFEVEVAKWGPVMAAKRGETARMADHGTTTLWRATRIAYLHSAIRSAANLRLDEVAAMLWATYGAGELSDLEAQALAEAVERRRGRTPWQRAGADSPMYRRQPPRPHTRSFIR